MAGGGTLAFVQAESTGAVIGISSVVERVTVLAAAGAAQSAAVAMGNGSVLRDSLVRTESPDGARGARLVRRCPPRERDRVATDPGSSAVYGDSAVGGICVPSSRIEIHATNVDRPRRPVRLRHPAPLRRGQQRAFRGGEHDALELPPGEVEPKPARLASRGGRRQSGRGAAVRVAAALDFHQLAGSPTIDAGVATPLLGTGDFDGGARTLGAAPDIGRTSTCRRRPPPPADTDRPVVSLLTVTPGRFRAAAAARHRAGTRISYALDEDATVTFTVKRIIQRVVRGRKRTAYRPVRGSFKDAGEVGRQLAPLQRTARRQAAEAGALPPDRAAGGRRGEHRQRRACPLSDQALSALRPRVAT